MIFDKQKKCPNCGGEHKHYDWVKRVTKEKYGIKKFIFVERRKCTNCGQLHRLLPNKLYPYKHYIRDIIDGVQLSFITCETLGYEDFPCEMTMQRWKNSRVDI